MQYIISLLVNTKFTCHCSLGKLLPDSWLGEQRQASQHMVSFSAKGDRVTPRCTELMIMCASIPPQMPVAY
ncbi:hypothetical protein AERO9A_320131 [Aeromonas salmonicida]|nr:hypothetical protein AERO9A_320131 [Aeromonas salmonicida]